MGAIAGMARSYKGTSCAQQKAILRKIRWICVTSERDER
ncbi:hypothetical protein J2T47_000623 [Pseudomonas nitroreducens]|nr:hypothetical protein [Pseudomonas nitroreducens]